MNYWNHRVIKHTAPTGDWYGIHEVFYDLGEEGDEDKLSWTDDAVGVTGDDVDDLRETLERMLRCLDKPVLNETELEQKYGK